MIDNANTNEPDGTPADEETGRAENRRVEIILIPSANATQPPGPSPKNFINDEDDTFVFVPSGGPSFDLGFVAVTPDDFAPTETGSVDPGAEFRPFAIASGASEPDLIF